MKTRGFGSISNQSDDLPAPLLDEGDALRLPVDLAESVPFALGGLRVSPPTRELAYADGDTETLEPRVMEALVALHRAQGSVLSRDDLTAACWRGNVVGEDAIQRVIQRLRKVAGLAGSFRIDTITKVGYRLIVEDSAGEGARGDAPSLAVLPFTNRSGQAEDEGLALGMSEDLIDALAQGVNVRVIASSATARFRDKPVTDFPGTGRRLGVRYFLEGNVRRSGDLLRVTAQLVEAANSSIVWSQRFERHLDEFAPLQGDLISEVAATLGATIFKLEMDRALRKPSNLTAWECIARAMAANREYGAEPLGRAIAESQHAMAIAPDYGLAQAIYALTISGAYFSISAPDPAREREIQHHIDRGFALDPDNAGVLAAIAASSAYIGRPTEGLPRARRAIRLRSGHGLAHYAAGINALLLGKEPDGIAHLDDFVQVEPESHLHYVTHAWRGVAYMRARDFSAARGAFAESLALFPGNFIALLMLTCIEQSEGKEAAASQHLATALELDAEATAGLYHTRIDRFFAGSDLLEQMHQVLDAVWLKVTA
ncbi:MAG: winged helix-turn-helix domain-containing protein [Novosphingobium sp.]|nr:winged helix-turn-helix domain-containing protein [Novosphingobium sp.]MBP6554617.1 winged helix-turn-helix domain-containing protein [Novosphingobium sp.]